jgi:ribosomal protein S18 acetylase RimI-like enzyme
MIELETTGTGDLEDVITALREWQSDDAPFQLHPGDLGWAWRLGEDELAAALRTWTSDGRIVAIGFLDGSDLLRLTVAPDRRSDPELAMRLVDDLGNPDRGILPTGNAYVEAPTGLLVRDRLAEFGWTIGDPWTPLVRDLAAPVDVPDVRVEVIGPDRAHVRVALQRAAFENSKMTIEKWHAMADGIPYSDARCLVAYSEQGDPVGAITVWSAGRGRPGLIEPMGVDPEFRGHGYGTAVTAAGAQVLRQLGASSAMVCTASAKVGAVATYKAAGLIALPERFDLAREG